jgi:3-hydroxybutyryl-CoA dehydrogenase
MNTLVLATEEQEAEVSLKFYNRAYLHLQDPAELKAWLPQADLVIDLLLHEQPERLAQYNQQGKGDKLTVFFNANHVNLTEFASAYAPLNFHLAGFIGQPLINREVLEVVTLREDSQRAVDKAFVFLASLYQLVKNKQ